MLTVAESMEEEQAENTELPETTMDKEAVDLNQLFPEAGLDLNAMFPDGETKKLLRQVKKNRRSNERFLEGFKKEKIWAEDE
ncbi:MAG: hypothetical protein ACLFVT_03620 [Syntrophobacteria bacterium]